MTNYRYLGYGVTNENGVAKLDHDANGDEIQHSYTGVGAGEVDVVASLDNPVDEGSIVSGTLSVFDCYRHDDGTISSHNDIWTGIINTDLTREAEYTTIKEKTVGTTATITFTGIPFKNYRIECDVFQVDGTRDEWFITVLKEDYSSITSADSKLGEWKHISLDLTNIAPNSRVRLNTGGSCTELRFKNFMLYPYGDNDVISINASNPVIQSTETTDITGSLFIDGGLQKNTNIDVYKNGTKVDTISTGSSGVASYTYTGSGAGATEFQFKYGSILSEIFVVTDYIKYDKGILDDSQTRNIYDNVSANALTRTTEYTSLKEVTTGTDVVAFISDLPSDYTIDFEVYQVDGITGNGIISMYSDNTYQNYFSISHIGGSVGNWLKLRLTVTEGSATLTDLDIPSRTKTQTFTGTVNRIRLSTGANISEIRWKDIKAYPTS